MKNPKPKLLIDFCTHDAASYACTHWHYSKSMPSGKTVKFGVWENERFIGVVIYGLGANAHIQKFNGKRTAELARIALREHRTPVTRIMAITIRKLKKFAPGLELLVSYADADQGHEGTIYKAGNWKFDTTTIAPWLKINGKMIHPRTVNAKYGTCSLDKLRAMGLRVSREDTKGKHRFLYYL